MIRSFQVGCNFPGCKAIVCNCGANYISAEVVLLDSLHDNVGSLSVGNRLLNNVHAKVGSLSMRQDRNRLLNNVHVCIENKTINISRPQLGFDKA